MLGSVSPPQDAIDNDDDPWWFVTARARRPEFFASCRAPRTGGRPLAALNPSDVSGTNRETGHAPERVARLRAT